MEMITELTPLLLILIILAGIVGLVIYFLPTMIAYKNRHPHTLWIFLINLIFGSSIIGWVIALIWAVKPDYDISKL